MMVGEVIEIQVRLRSGLRRKGDGGFYRMSRRWLDRLEVNKE